MKTIRRYWLLLLLLIAALVVGPTSFLYADDANQGDDNEQPEGSDFISDEVLVQLQSPGALDSFLADYSLSLIDQFGTRPIYRLRITTGVEPPAQAETLLNDSRVVFAEPNFFGATPESDRRRGGWSVGGDDIAFVAQWAPNTIRLVEAHEITRGSDTVVAVLDTGIDRDHPAFAGVLLPGFDFVDFDDDPSEEGTRDNIGYGHGTHVAGLVRLVAPDAKLLPVRVLDPEGVGNIWVLAEGLAYAADPDGNPMTDDGADVINLSLSTTRPTRLVDELLDELTCDVDDDDTNRLVNDDSDDDTGGDDSDDDIGGDDSGDDTGGDDTGGDDSGSNPGNDASDDDDCPYFGGIIVVAGAGNTGTGEPQYPAAEDVDGLLAVGASTQADTLATFSTHGSWVDLAAPGQGILSTVPDSNYGTWSGTSMSAPMIAGTAALVRSQSPTLDAVSVASRIVNSATPICAPLNRLDAAAALGVSIGQTSSCLVFLPMAQ